MCDYVNRADVEPSVPDHLAAGLHQEHRKLKDLFIYFKVRVTQRKENTQRKRESEREGERILHILTHSPNSHNSWS